MNWMKEKEKNKIKRGDEKKKVEGKVNVLISVKLYAVVIPWFGTLIKNITKNLIFKSKFLFGYSSIKK